MKKFLSISLIILILSGVPAVSAQKRNGGSAAAAPRLGNIDAITAQKMKDHLTFIASDELEGRDTPSRGLDIAALYIAQHLASWGVKPGGEDGTYFQKVPLRLEKIEPQNTRFDISGRSYVYGEDFLATLSPAQISGSSFVFAGHGWVIKS
ncbi:MAG: hypothetical protein H7070_11610, partial [Saprospiraceae bacterium]|nr:hypothetical protein [Pyrinomonadaceae bacterium]